MINPKYLGLLVVIAIVLIGIGVYANNQEVEEYVPLLEFKTTEISPSPVIIDASVIKVGESATITVDVKSLSDEYKNNGKINIAFENKDAYQYFKILQDTKDVGTIQREGATSGPISFKISAIKDPGSYEDSVIVKLLIDKNLNDVASFPLKIE